MGSNLLNSRSVRSNQKRHFSPGLAPKPTKTAAAEATVNLAQGQVQMVYR